MENSRWSEESAGNLEGCMRAQGYVCSAHSSCCPFHLLSFKGEAQLWLGFSMEPALGFQQCLEH